MEELTAILCKWAPIIAKDEDMKAFTLVETGKRVQEESTKKSTDDLFSNMFGKDTKSNPFSDIFGEFGNMFGKK